MKIVASLPQAPAAVHALNKAQKAAQDFEAVLLGSLLQSLQETFSGFGDGGTPGSGDYGYMGAEALASAMAARGGIGIARMIVEHLRDTKVSGAG